MLCKSFFLLLSVIDYYGIHARFSEFSSTPTSKAKSKIDNEIGNRKELNSHALNGLWGLKSASSTLSSISS